MDSTTFNIIVVIVYVICIPGVCFSILSFCIICAKPSFHNAFGCLCLADVIAEAGIIFTFALAVSLTLLYPTSVDSTFMAALGYISIFTHRTTAYFHFYKSFNRFCAVVIYWKYSSIFSIKNTLFLIALCIGLSIFHTYLYLSYSCNLIFSSTSLGWQRRDAKCIISGQDFTFTMTVISYSGSILFNVATIAYLRFWMKKLAHQKKLSWIEKRFLFQTFSTSIIYVIALCCRYLITPLGVTVIAHYLIATMPWIFFCLLNEAIFSLSTINLKQFFKSPISISALFKKQ